MGEEAKRARGIAGLGGLFRAAAAGIERLANDAGSAPWPELVGVDLGDSTLKVVYAARRGRRLVEVRAARRAVPGASEAKPAERREALRKALAQAVAECGLRGKPAAGSVFGSEVVVRRVTLPAMKRADLLPALRLECRKHVNFPIEESEIRYEVLPAGAGSAVGEQQLLVTIAHARRVAELREAMEAAGLRPVAITIGAVALRALLRTGGALDPNEVVAYLDMGAGNTHIMVLKGEEIRFSREFGLGGDALTEALRSIVVPGQGTVELTAEEAEALKRSHGIPLGAEETGQAGRIPLSAVAVMLRPTLERLARELWNSFDYCNEQFLGEAVTRIALLGDASRIRNLPEYLSAVLKIPVARADLTRQVWERAVGAGAAAREGGAPSDRGFGLSLIERGAINFLAPAERGTPYRLAEAVPQHAAAAVAAMLLLSVSLPAELTVQTQRERVADLKRSLAQLAPRAEALQRFRTAREEETRLHDLLAHLSGGQVLWSYFLRDLSHRVGADARLTALEVVASAPSAVAGAPPPGRAVRFTGLLRTQHRRAEEVLAELMRSLERSAVLEQVRLEGCEAVTPVLSSFTLTAELSE